MPIISIDTIIIIIPINRTDVAFDRIRSTIGSMGRWKNIKSIESIQARTSKATRHTMGVCSFNNGPRTARSGPIWKVNPFSKWVGIRPPHSHSTRWCMKIDGKTGLQKQRLLKDN